MALLGGAFIDKAMTGTNGNRPAFQKMLSDSERSDAFEIVLVCAIDRFKIHGTRRFIVVSKKRLRYGSKRAAKAKTRRLATCFTKEKPDRTFRVRSGGSWWEL